VLKEFAKRPEVASFCRGDHGGDFFRKYAESEFAAQENAARSDASGGGSARRSAAKPTEEIAEAHDFAFTRAV